MDAITAVVVEMGGWGMSPDVIAVGVFSIVGAVAGAVAGLLGERWRRSWGKVRYEIDAWTGEEISSFGAPEARHFEVDIYNEKEFALALWDIHMEVVPEDGEPERVGLELTSTGERVSMLNLPSHVAISEVMRVTARGATLHRIKHARKLRFVGIIPGGKEFSKELPRW
jgi:hypothetical protein